MNNYSLPNDIYKRGNVVWVNLSETNNNSVQKGVRRAVIISNNVNNEHSSLVHILPCTTKWKKFFLHIRRNNGYEDICCEQAMLIPKSDIMFDRAIDHLAPNEMEKVESALKIQFGFN